MPISLVLLRRDLRLEDNTALNEAFAAGDPVLPVFIVDEYLVERWRHAGKRLAFLFQSVRDLACEVEDRGGQLVVREGRADDVLADLLSAHVVARVFANREYTPLGIQRDELLQSVCSEAGVPIGFPDDALLNPPAVVRKADGNPYTVFTPYFRKASTYPVASPETRDGKFHSVRESSLEDATSISSFLEMQLPEVQTGIKGAAAALEKLSLLGDYQNQRDMPATGMTSRLSCHLRFGTCSARQVYAEVVDVLGGDHPLIRQLYWRDFYVQIAWHFPHVFRQAFRKVYDGIPWQDDEHAYELWQAGRTGFPIVDAGMRELAATGYMHNRVRMIVASFLTKNLHIDWRRGEDHFAAHLIDYDPAVNNGNWQWGASTGCDAQPYFRVFNPWRQQQKFDRDCVYIKQWVPELEPYPAAAIHRLEKEGDFYLPQIADLKSSSEAIKQAFKSVKQG